MDKAPDFGSGDCRFESCHARLHFSAFKFSVLDHMIYLMIEMHRNLS